METCLDIKKYRNSLKANHICQKMFKVLTTDIKILTLQLTPFWIILPKIHFFNLNRIMFERRTANGELQTAVRGSR